MAEEHEIGLWRAENARRENRLSMPLKSLPRIFDSGMPRLFEIEQFLFDPIIPRDREALLPKIIGTGSSNGRAARIWDRGDMRGALETILRKGDRLAGAAPWNAWPWLVRPTIA